MTITVKSDSLGCLALVPRGVRLVRIVRTFALLLLIATPLWLRPAHAQSPALLDMVNTLSANGTFAFDALERQAAIAKATSGVCASAAPRAEIAWRPP